MKYRVDLNFIGNGAAGACYGGHLRAWSFVNTSGEAWFQDFRTQAIDAIGKRYLPIYRMADGEFRFLMGRKFNPHRRPFYRELLGVAAERLRIRNPDRWATSWGETYRPEEVRSLRSKLIADVDFIARKGFLACYINDNALNAFTEYNAYLPQFLTSRGIPFSQKNYVPFHFPVGLLTGDECEELYRRRKILVATGELSESRQVSILNNLQRLGVEDVQFMELSATSAMKDCLDFSRLRPVVDIVLVAAGIGSANVLSQLERLQTLVIDIGGFVNCLADDNVSQHGNLFRYPIHKIIS